MKAMILAAGRGERMRPLTNDTPKPLLPVGGKPLVVWTIEALARAGFHEIVMNVSHLGQRIEQALGRGDSWGVDIRYSHEAEPLETAGGIATAMPLLGEAPFAVVNADIHTDYDFRRLREALDEPHALAYLVLVDNPEHHPRGDFALNGRQVRNSGEIMRTFSGIGVYRPQLFAQIAPHTKAQLASLLRPQIEAGRVIGEHYIGRWSDVGTPERLADIDRLASAAQELSRT